MIFEQNFVALSVILGSVLFYKTNLKKILDKKSLRCPYLCDAPGISKMLAFCNKIHTVARRSVLWLNPLLGYVGLKTFTKSQWTFANFIFGLLFSTKMCFLFDTEWNRLKLTSKWEALICTRMYIVLVVHSNTNVGIKVWIHEKCMTYSKLVHIKSFCQSKYKVGVSMASL